MSGVALKLFFSSRATSFGRTCWSLTQNIHEELAHCVIGLMQVGYCSAPMTRFPPRLTFPLGPLAELLLPLDPQAAATIESARPTTMSPATRRLLCTRAPPLGPPSLAS